MNLPKRSLIAISLITFALVDVIFYALLPVLVRAQENDVYSAVANVADSNRDDAGGGPLLTLIDPSGTVLETGDQAQRVFFAKLIETNPKIERAVVALQKNSKFQGLWKYVSSHRLALCLDPTLKSAATGKPLYGSFRNRGSLLILNPAHPEVAKNPLELLDTLLHECIHAAQYMHQLDRQMKANSVAVAYPLPANVLDGQSDSVWHWAINDYCLTADELRGLKGNPSRVAADTKLARLKEYLDLHYGPSSSNPDGKYEDINVYAQKFIVEVLGSVAEETKLPPTLTFGRFQAIARVRGQEFDSLLPSNHLGVIRLGERFWRNLNR